MLQFKQSEYDHSLFIKNTSTCTVLVLVYIDDMLVTGDSLQVIEETKDKLKHFFKMKDLGELKYFLGIEFARSNKGILMNQRKYTLELIAEIGLSASKPAVTPIDTNCKLTTKQFDDFTKSGAESKAIKNGSMVDQGVYQRLIVKLLYLTMIRPGISYGVQTLSQFLQQPKKSHMEATLRIVRYIKNQPGQGILRIVRYSYNIL